MKPDSETIDKFQKLYFEEFGEEITREEAYEKFLRLTNFMRVILLPDSRDEEGINNADFAELDAKPEHDIFMSNPSEIL